MKGSMTRGGGTRATTPVQTEVPGPRGESESKDLRSWDPVIDVGGLVQRFGSRTVVDGLSFTVRRGEIFGLLGPNGSGKTTTINLISGLAVPTSGTATVFGRDPRRQAASVRRLLGVVPQETALYEELTARANLKFHADLFGYTGQDRRQRVEAMLDLAQLSDRADSRVGTFSGGMKRRLAIARALLHDPALVYLDEPTLGVDVQARHVIWDYIGAMKREGRTVLLTTNYLEEAEALCDRLAVIDHGQLVALDTPAGLKARFGSALVETELEEAASPDLLARLEAIPAVDRVEADGTRVRLALASTDGAAAGGAGPQAAGGPAAVLPHVLDVLQHGGATARRLNLREPSLDEVFLALTGKGVRD